jgi:outer membrane protein, multidrug efflux system
MVTETKRGRARPIQWLILGGVTLAMAFGCATVGPEYRRPQSSLPSGWTSPAKEGVVTSVKGDTPSLEGWWKNLDDPVLTGLVERAVEGNTDLKKAKARIRQARASRAVTGAALLPSVNASGSLASSGQGKKADLSNTTDLYSAGLDANWELDIFGGVRRSVEAATADLSAAEEDLRDVLVTLLAEVALNYVDLRTYQGRLAVAEANLASQNDTFQLAGWRNQAGLSDDLAVQQARYNLESTKSQIPTLRTGAEEAANRLAVLLGEQPGALRGELKVISPIPAAPIEIAVGVPADVLRRRPDIRKAERQLAAETARIGVARANLYPKLTLGGSIGIEALSLGNLFTLSNKAFSYGPKITWPLFDGGAIRKGIEVQSAIQEQTLIAYEAIILTALEEVENALTAFGEEQQRRASLVEASRAAQLAAKLAEQKYQAGLADFTSVLDAQRSLLTYRDQLVQSEGAVTADLVRLYKALGGGWTSFAPEQEVRENQGEKK